MKRTDANRSVIDRHEIPKDDTFVIFPHFRINMEIVCFLKEYE